MRNTTAKPAAIYSYKEIDRLIDRLIRRGYDCIQTQEGVLGSGNWICVSPDEHHLHVVVNEIYLNSWSSGHIIRRYRKLTKAHRKELEELWETR